MNDKADFRRIEATSLPDDVKRGGDASLNYAAILKIVIRRPGVLALGVLLGLLLGLIVAHVAPVRYPASMTVRQPEQSGPNVGGALSRLAGLGGAAGLTSVFSGASQSDFDSFVILLTSKSLGERVATENPRLMHEIFSRNWNPQTRQWQHSGMRAAIGDFGRLILGMPAWHAPTGEDLTRYLAKELVISTDTQTGFVTFSYQNKDPRIAVDVIRSLHAEADEMVRDSARNKSVRRIAYLEKVLPKVTLTDEHEALTQLLVSEEQKRMTVQADKFYSAVPVDYPVVAQSPAGISPILIVALTLILGLCGAALYVLMQSPLWPDVRRFLRAP